MNDIARRDATGPDYEYALPIDRVADLYAAAGFPRTIRTLQRYCKSKHLDAELVATALGDKYFVAPYSVRRHLAQIAEMAQLAERGTSPDVSRQGAAHVSPTHKGIFQPATGHDQHTSGHVATDHDYTRQPAAIDNDSHDIETTTGTRQGTTSEGRPNPAAHVEARQDATRPVDDGLSPKYVEVLERENAFLRDQVTKKDHQIAAMLERDRETNVLVQGLQRMLAPLLGGPRRDETDPDASRH